MVAVPVVMPVVTPLSATSPKASGVVLSEHTVDTVALTARLLVVVAAQESGATKAATMAVVARRKRSMFQDPFHDCSKCSGATKTLLSISMFIILKLVPNH